MRDRNRFRHRQLLSDEVPGQDGFHRSALCQQHQGRASVRADVATTDIDDIINERRKELFAEGQIAFDFWRNGKTIRVDVREFAPDNNYNVLPIPKEELDYNGPILQQNPGF